MWSDNETTQDLLGYQVHADLLQKIILNKAMLPITIGVFGNWGSGKSSLMLLLHKGITTWNNEQSQKDSSSKDDINDKERILQIKFNSWQFENYDATKLVMIDTILESIKTDISNNTDIFEKADDFLARISLLKAGLFILKKAGPQIGRASCRERGKPMIISPQNLSKNGFLIKKSLIK